MKWRANDIVNDAKKLKIPLTRRAANGKRVKRSVRELEHAVRTKKVDRLMRKEWAAYKKSNNFDKNFYNSAPNNNMSARYKMFHSFVNNHFSNGMTGLYFPSNNVARILRNWEKHRNTSSALNKLAKAFSNARWNQNRSNGNRRQNAQNLYEWYVNNNGLYKR